MKKLLLVVVLAIVPFSLYAQAFYADTNLLDKRSARQQNHKKTPNSHI
ncbi:MAG: hypothetical protein IKO35_02925 [Elusimicrobiaceae bacterium]|nr:hypothetical protein [Elusimicrobiaceae bacterium]